MDQDLSAVYQLLEQAQTALKAGDRNTARQLAVQASQLAPELEDAWLLMAAVASPRERIPYLQKALQINPHSQRAQKGMAWAMESLRKEQAKQDAADAVVPVSGQPYEQPFAVAMEQPISEPVSPEMSASQDQPLDPVFAVPDQMEAEPDQPQKASNRKWIVIAAILILLICLACTAIAMLSSSQISTLFGTLFNQPTLTPAQVTLPTETASPLSTETFLVVPSATAFFALPATYTPAATFTPTWTFTPTLTETPVPVETQTLEQTPTPFPTDISTEEASPTPLPTDTEEPLPTESLAQSPGSTSAKTASAPAPGGTHWIDVDLTNQMVYAYEGQTIVNSFLVSTGAAPRLTVTGSYHVYERYVKANMWGPGYFLPDVPYTMYFHKGFALHGTYWHSNFGTPVSHGCVNLATPDAEWLYYWSSMGTLVKVHY